MRPKVWMLMMVLLLGTVCLTGCFESDPVVRSLRSENADLKSRVAELDSQNVRLKRDVSETERATELAEVEAERWKTQYQEAIKIKAPGGSGVSADVIAKLMAIGRQGQHWDYTDGVLRAQSDILFASGKADLKAQAQATVAEVAPMLKEILTDKSLVVRVDGHTDSDPITRSGWKDNLHLSLMRAWAVGTMLKEQGVPADSVLAAGWGESRPIPGGTKDKNRRVELVIVPRGR